MHKALALPVVIALALAACGGGDDAPRAADPPPATTAPPEQTATPAMEIGVDLPPGVTAEMVSQGQQLYGTICVACHGAAGTGSPLGPSLNDQDWVHISGEFEEIVNITRTGVPQPRDYPTPMVPMGGGNFSDDQLRAIGAYVYVLSHGG